MSLASYLAAPPRDSELSANPPQRVTTPIIAYHRVSDKVQLSCLPSTGRDADVEGRQADVQNEGVRSMFSADSGSVDLWPVVRKMDQTPTLQSSWGVHTKRVHPSGIPHSIFPVWLLRTGYFRLLLP